MVARTAPKTIQVKSPGRLDFKKADKVLKKIVRENKEWLKEMATK